MKQNGNFDSGRPDELTIIIVSWNACGYLKGCLNSLRDALDAGICNVIVVDNGSTDGSPELASAFHPRVSLMQTGSNLGFAKANNLALAQATTPYVMLLNSDTVFSSSALTTMTALMKARPEFWVCGCQHVDGSAATQNPFGRFPSLRSEFITMTGLFAWPVFRTLISLRKSRRVNSVASSSGSGEAAKDLVVPVDYVSGASMMLHRERISKLGGLDESFFFYSEDADLCKRVWDHGGQVGFIPGVVITHYGGGSYGSRYLFVLGKWMQTRLTFFRKHYGRRSAITLHLIYCLAGMLSVLKWSGIYVCRVKRRKEARQWIDFWIGSLRGQHVVGDDHGPCT